MLQRVRGSVNVVKPKPFIPKTFNGQEKYIRDESDGLVWHRCKHRTIYADTDCSKVVYHANYLLYFEIGRGSLMREAAYPYKEVEESGFVYPIIEIGVQYYNPLYYDDPMWIHTRPGEKERVKMMFDYVITHAESGDLVCKGFTKHCAINSNGNPTAIDEKTISLWEKFPK